MESSEAILVSIRDTDKTKIIKLLSDLPIKYKPKLVDNNNIDSQSLAMDPNI